MNSSRRMSIGGGPLRDGGGPLRDGTNRRSNNRRASLGGGALRVQQGASAAASSNTTPRKHPRDALLDWRSSNSRQSSAFDENHHQGSVYDSANKRRRPNFPPPRLPPSSRPSANKAVKQEPHDGDDTFTGNTSFAVPPPDYQESGEYYSSALTASSPFASSRMSAASPFTSRMASRRRSLAPTSTFKTMGGGFLSQESDASYDQQPMMSQDTIQSDPLPIGRSSDVAALGEEEDSLDHVGERSRIQTLEEKIKLLEKEKKDLLTSTAPLEARLLQRSIEWEKKEAGLLQEIEALKKKCQKANDISEVLKNTIETKEEEIRGLKMEQLKAGNTVINKNNGSALTSGNSNWNRHLQTNREVEEMNEKLKATEEELESMTLTKQSLESDLRAKNFELESFQSKFDRLQAEYDKISKSSSKETEAQLSLDKLSEVYEATTAQLNATQSELAETKARAEAELASTKKGLEEKVEKLEFEMDVLRHQVPEQTENIDGEDKENDVAVWKARYDALARRVQELELLVAKLEEQRRQLHNVIQELRGNIRVFVRTRPFLGGDGSVQENAIDMKPDGEQLTIFDKRSNQPYNFKFDKTFSASSGQDQVFEEVSDFVQSALDGYHVCLFSYGQTGSGKTHTMQGTGDGPMRGIIPRAVEQILSASRVMRAQNWTFSLRVSFLEIYNEELKDLLIPFNKNASSLAKNPKKLAIKRPRGSKSYVDGLTEVAINTTDELEGKQQLQQLMEVAARSRSVAKTKMNSKSSRSHSVFMLHLNGYNEDTGAQVSGALNLCDLAGSERLDRSGVGNDSQRLRETQAINKSLSCLGDVFNALTSGAPHVPYRNSKLTYLLQDCLSGDGKALMFVNLSPTMASSNESLCSLKFAERVNKVELGKAKKNIQYTK